MKTIWKFPLQVTDEQSVMMPAGSQPLTVQIQGEQVCLWALVNPDAEKEDRTVQIFGTGHPVKVAGDYISTFQMRGGALVFHAFII